MRRATCAAQDRRFSEKRINDTDALPLYHLPNFAQRPNPIIQPTLQNKFSNGLALAFEHVAHLHALAVGRRQAGGPFSWEGGGSALGPLGSATEYPFAGPNSGRVSFESS